MKIGAQFYTLRDKCQDLEGLSASLKKIKEIGYNYVQISGVCKYDAKWLKDELDKIGLTCVLTHFSADEILNNTEEVVKFHNIFGCKNIGLGSMPYKVNEENLYKFIEEFKPVARKIKELGSTLCYHNHHWEFSKCADGKYIMDKLAEAFEPDELHFTLDTYWVQFGGCDVCDVIDKLSGRLTCVHLKDFLLVGEEQRMASVGSGSLSFPKIIKHLEAAGTEYALVEQDNCYGKCPFECLKNSYEYLRGIIND